MSPAQRTAFAVEPLLELLREEDVAELAQAVRLPGLVRPFPLGVEVVPLHRRSEQMGRAGNRHHSSVRALEQARHQPVGEAEMS